MTSLDPEGIEKAFGLRDVHDLMEKLRWEIDDLRENPKWAAQIRQYKAFNCAVTVWHVIDWVFEGITPDIHAAIAAEIGVTKVTKGELDKFVFAQCREVALCRQMATGSKHRRVAIKNDESVASSMSAVLEPRIKRLDGSSYEPAPYYEAKIIDADNRRVALDVFDRAQLYLTKLIRKWKIDQREEIYGLGDA